MRVLAVAQAFKGSLSAPDVADALAAGVRAAGAEADVLIGSDGGDGLLDAVAPGILRRSTYQATGPLGARVEVPVGWLDHRTAVLESRMVCGLSLLPPDRRDPARATTRGVGEVISAVVGDGATTVFVGLGGSATMDAGEGMASAWTVPPPARLVGLCDVLVPLLGAGRFAAQKGADPATAERLLAHLVALAASHPVAAAVPGAGAAGGLGFGLLVWGRGTLEAGAPWVLARQGFADRLRQADLILVTEGAFDATSGAGKLSGHVLDVAAGRRRGIVAPRVTDPPAGVLVESGEGVWDGAVLARRTEALVRRASAP